MQQNLSGPSALCSLAVVVVPVAGAILAALAWKFGFEKE
jgi:hypothetical protein